MALIVTAVLTVRALFRSMSITIPSTTDIDTSIPIELAKLKLATDTSASATATATTRTINGWQRLKPSHGGTVYGEFDSLTIGKSCRWQHTSFYYPNKVLSWVFFFSRNSFLGKWVCRDCGQESLAWESCPVLRPRGKCPAFDYQGWEEPRPRSASTYDPFSSSPHPVRLITSYGVGKVRKVEYEQPQCLSLTKPCFDMNRCTTTANLAVNNGTTTNDRKLMQPLPVFAYPGQARVDLKDVLNGKGFISSTNIADSAIPTGTEIRIVEDPSMACLLISHADDLNTAKASSSWNLGINHYVYGVTKPISENAHYDMAALGSVVMTEAQIRPGYDISLPLPAIWTIGHLHKKQPNSGRILLEDLHRPRKYLLTFKGSIQDTVQPYYQHRWLAAEYLYQEPDVAIDVQCKHKTLWGDTVTFARYDNPSQDNFDDLMVNSTFAFCPGGSHVTSFRFTEVLSAGAIPILLPEIVTPFYPELDWSDCVIRVSQARIVDLPRVLRVIPPERVRERQLNCQRLYRTFLNVHHHEKRVDENGVNNNVDRSPGNGATTNTAGFLATALKVWHLRVEKQNYGNQLESRFSFGSN